MAFFKFFTTRLFKDEEGEGSFVFMVNKIDRIFPFIL